MIDLFTAGEIVATRSHPEYEFVAHGLPVARTRSRPVAAVHWWSWFVRLLGASTATQYLTIDVASVLGIAARWQTQRTRPFS